MRHGMQLKKHRLVRVLGLIATAPLLAAEPSAAQPRLNEVTVTATRTERDIDLTSKPVSIITREQIAARNARNVQELLAEVPGVSLSRAGGLDGQIVLRGSNSNDPRTVLFIDGDRFRGRNTLEYMLLDPNQIERIEVLRGPASSLYGPDAIAGVVNIITRRARGDTTGAFQVAPRLVAVQANNVNDLFGGRVELQGLGNGMDMLFGLNARAANNYASPEGEIANSDFKTASADLRLGYAVNADARVELIAKLAEVEAGRAGGIGGAPGNPLLRLREDPLREQFLKVGYSDKNGALGFTQTEASLYARRLYTRIAAENRTAANRRVAAENWVDGPLIVGGKWLGLRAWGDGVWTLGTDFFNEDRKGTEQASTTTNLDAAGNVTSVSTSPRRQNAPDAKQLDLGVFAYNDWDPTPTWTVSTGARLDYIRTASATSPVPDPSLQAAYDSANANTETPLTGSIGAVFRPWQTVHFTGNIGKAFRAPATFESFGSSRQGAGFLVPNPDLQSEQALVYEVGTRLRLAEVVANLTTFYNDYSNLIVTRPVTFQGTNSSQRQNVGAARVTGVELDAVWTFAPRWQASMNAAQLRGTDTATGRPLPYIPPLNGQIGLRYGALDGLYLEGVGKWSARKRRIDARQERESAGFAVLNLYAGLDLPKRRTGAARLSLRLGVENVFDKTYRQPTTVENVNFPVSNTNPLLEPGRAYSLSVRSEF